MTTQSILVKFKVDPLYCILRILPIYTLSHSPRCSHDLHFSTALSSYTMCYVGEFGIVYKAHLVKLGQSIPEVIAVKTLKG